MLIYIYRNRLNDKVYIGKTAFSLKKRHSEHLSDVRYGSKTYFHNALRKNGEANFDLCAVSSASSPEELDKLEVHFIQHYRANDPKYGYNLTSGGDGGIPTDAVRAKLRAVRKGRTSPAKGKKWSAESRKRKSESLQGRPPSNITVAPLTAKHKGNISKELKGKKKPAAFADKIRQSRQGTKLVVVDGKRRFVKV
jgi:group I intron endonuclease